MIPENQKNRLQDSGKEDGFFFDAFLSYSRRDSLVVRELVSRLEKKGVATWFDEQQIDVGDSITEKIQRGLRSSRYLIVCLSRHFKDSEWCKREYHNHLAQEIKERTVRVLPVRLDDYVDEEVPDFLFDKYAVDVRVDEGLSRLVRKVKSQLQIQSSGSVKLWETDAHRIDVKPEKPEEKDSLDAAVQLWFPHGIARSFFEVTQKTDSGERLGAVGTCVDNILGFLTVLCVADYAAHHAHREVLDLKPLFVDLDKKAVSERIEILSKLIGVTNRSQARRTFIPHLSAWALESEGHPSAHFLTLFKLALALHAKEIAGEAVVRRAEELLRRLLDSLLWLQSFRLVVIEDVQRPRPTLAKGRSKSLVGVVRGFLPEPFLWQVSPTAQIERGCYLINPGRSGLLRLHPFLVTRGEIPVSSGEFKGGDLWTLSGVDGVCLVFCDASGEKLRSVLKKGNPLSVEFSLREADRIIAIKPMDERLVPNLRETEDEAVGENDAEVAAEAEFDKGEASFNDFEGYLVRIQTALLALGAVSLSSDRMLVELDGTGADLVDAFERFPGHAESFQEVALEWSRQVDQVLESLRTEEVRLVLISRRREVEVGLEDLLGGFSLSQGLFMNGARYQEESPYATGATGIRDLEYGLKLLLSKDELDQSDGISWLFGSSFTDCERLLEDAVKSGRRSLILDILWRRFARIFLYYKEHFWELAKYMLRAEPARWRSRLESFRRVLEREICVEEVRTIISKLDLDDQPPIAAFLAMHPRKSCREIGMALLKPSDRWEILLAPATHTTVIRELVEIICKDSSPSYIKAMFLLLRGRLRSADTPLTLNHSFEILKIFYQVPLFLEAAFFKALLALHKDLNVQAQKSYEMAEIGKRFELYLEDFRRKIHARDMDITEMHCIPLPIQRKLARDGYFVDVFICNVRDPIALEAVPHALRRPDVVRFFRSPLVNKSALQRLADDKHIMREQIIRAALCRNPKADPQQVRKFMPTLGVSEFRSISEDKGVSQYARNFARQLLMLKTS